MISYFTDGNNSHLYYKETSSLLYKKSNLWRASTQVDMNMFPFVCTLVLGKTLVLTFSIW